MTHHTARRPLLVIVTIVAICVLAINGPASAHDTLVSSSPANGAKLTAAPSRVVLTFNEALKEPAYAAVKVGDNPGQKAGATIKGDTLMVDTSTLPVSEAGQSVPWTVSYRIVSEDGHPVSGEIVFDVTPKGQATSTVSPSPSPAAQSSSAAAQGSDGGGGSTWLWVAGAVVVVIGGLAAAGTIIARRR